MNDAEKYNNAIKLWLTKNNYDLKRMRGHKANKDLTDKEFISLIGGRLDFVGTPEWRYSTYTWGGGGEAAIEFTFRKKQYTHELEDVLTGQFIMEVSQLIGVIK